MRRRWFPVLFLLVLLVGACNMPVNAPTGGEVDTQAFEQLTAEAGDKILQTAIPLLEQATETARAFEPVPISVQNAASLVESGMAELNNPYGLSWSTDSALLGAVTQEGMLLFDSATLAVKSNVMVQQPISLLDFSSANGLMATTTDQKTIDLRDVASGDLRGTVLSPSPVMGVVFSPDGTLLAAPLADQFGVDIWNVGTVQRMGTLIGFETAAPTYGVSFSRDGRNIIWVARGTAMVMDVESGAAGEYLNHEEFIGATALTPDEQTLAVATAGLTGDTFTPFIQLWNPWNGEDLGRIPTGETIMSTLDVSPDGSLLAGGRNTEVVIWDLSNQQEIAVLDSHTDRVTSVSFSPDGTMLASTAVDGTSRIWRVPQP